MRSLGMSPFCAALVLLVQSLLFIACTPASLTGKVQRKDLFSVGYGMSENQVDLSSQGRDGMDLTMSQGIFHMLDGRSRKVMRFSSYGDLLALLYDPLISPVPRIVQPLATPGADTTEDKGQALAGRYAVPLTFTQPRKMAVGKDQTMYVADRGTASSDWVVRRFGAMGIEKAYLGQEGPGGSPFPAVLSMDVLGDDTLGVVSATESGYLVHHFGKEGNLLSSLRIGRDALPLPQELADTGGGRPDGGRTEAGGTASRIHTNLDGMILTSEGESFGVILKLDYYREFYDSASLVIARNEFSGSWIIAMDGWTGRILYNTRIAAGGQESPAPELIGLNSGLYYMLYASTSSDEPRIIQLMDDKGKIHRRVRISAPEGAREMITIRVSAEGQVYALFKMDEEVQVSLWNFR
ncbi:MAG: hypothetical protein Q8O15_00860 [Rectinemataceae bacterium]|nr:hypothetical protein [Rectinemataceae bacterium]